LEHLFHSTVAAIASPTPPGYTNRKGAASLRLTQAPSTTSAGEHTLNLTLAPLANSASERALTLKPIYTSAQRFAMKRFRKNVESNVFSRQMLVQLFYGKYWFNILFEKYCNMFFKKNVATFYN
jgi:hypothetical protein